MEWRAHRSTGDGVMAAGGPVETARLGWQRARLFSVLARSPRSWAGVLTAPWVWPAEMLMVALSGGQVRRLAEASMTVAGAAPAKRKGRVVGLAVLVVLVQLAVLVVAAGVLATALVGLLTPGWATLVAMVVLVGPLLLELAARLRRLVPQEVRTLNARRRSLAAAGGPVYVISAFVARTPGEGARLLSALQRRWAAEGAVVLFNPANEALALYYARHGAVPDGSTWRRMRFDYRPTVAAVDGC